MLPKSSESFYEYAWAAREMLFEKIISGGENSLQRALHQFALYEGTHEFKVEIVNGRVEETGEILKFYSGNIQISEMSDVSRDELKDQIEGVYERVRFLSEFLDDDVEAIVELGSGYGLNLFRLREILGDRPLRYFAAEYTESGRRLSARLAGLDGGMPLEVAFIDHKAPNLDFLKGIGKALIFTCHSIEQVNRIPDDYFSILADAAENIRVIHMEPFGFQVPDFVGKFPGQVGYFENNDWNGNFYETLRAAEEAGTIQLERVELEKFFVQLGNPTSIAVWDSP